VILLLASLGFLLALAGAMDLLRGYGVRVDALIRRAAGVKVSWAGTSRSIAEVFDSLGTEHRLRRAGLEFEMPVSRLMLMKAFACLSGLIVGAAMAYLAGGGRLLTAIALAMPVVFFLAPDAALEWIGRKRSRMIERGLSDALDLAANGIGSGEDPLGALSGSSGRAGPLGLELRMLSAERDCGLNRTEVLAGLKERVPIPEIATLSATIERSARFGSPVSERFRQQAEEIRRSQRRRISEQAARSSPRIQLVVALLLVPSVLLMIAAGLLSNLGSFISGL
jgi:tight adherence protein C